jgi:hypothetical protein
MAQQLTAAQKQELARFATALYSFGGFTTQAQVAEETGAHQTNVSEWLGGKTGISGWNLYRLIVAVARRQGEEPLEVALRASRVSDPLAGLSGEVAEIRDMMDEALGLLRAAPQRDDGADEPPSQGERAG